MGYKGVAELFQEGEELPKLPGCGFHAGPSAGTHLETGWMGVPLCPKSAASRAGDIMPILVMCEQRPHLSHQSFPGLVKYGAACLQS